MPRIVPLPSPGASKAPPHKRRGRDLAAVLLATAAADHTPRPRATVRGVSHVSYDLQCPHRVENARHLNARARKILGVEGFGV